MENYTILVCYRLYFIAFDQILIEVDSSSYARRSAEHHRARSPEHQLVDKYIKYSLYVLTLIPYLIEQLDTINNYKFLSTMIRIIIDIIVQ